MIRLDVNDLTKTYGSSTPLTATVYTDNTPLTGATVKFRINGVNYQRTSDGNGKVQLAINLNVGAYYCTVSCNGVSKKVLVRVVSKPDINLIVSNFTKTYGDSTPLTVRVDVPAIITGIPIRFTINGVTYNRTTDVNGEAKLNINLLPGIYPCMVVFPGNNSYKETKKEITVTVKANTMIDGFNITKSYSDAGFYQCAVYDQWQRLNPCTVTLTINGVSYTRSTNSEGLIRLNIRLQPGEYPINVKYNGDATHNPSSRNDLVTVVHDIQEIGKRTSEGVHIPGDNQGYLESHIYVYQSNLENDKKNKTRYQIMTWAYKSVMQDIPFTNYEITETDPRVKTAKFTTDRYFDLTSGRCFVQIASPYHENFGGIILKVEYDKNTGLYTYQCQDGRRQYLSKKVTTIQPSSVTIYDTLESLLVTPGHDYRSEMPVPITPEQRALHAPLLSGLHPIDDYDNLSDVGIKFDNKFKEQFQAISTDSLIDTIMNLSHAGGFPTDVYFTHDLICHIDPVDIDHWLTHGIRLTHQDLVHYKYGFDTTNILTGINIKADNASYKYMEDADDLSFYFGGNVGMVDAVTDTVTTESMGASTTGANTVSTGIMSGTKTFDVGQDGGIVSDYRLDLIKALREKGHTVNDLGVGHSVVQNNGLRASSKGHIGIFICNGICCGTHQDFLNGFNRGFYHYDHVIFTWVRGDIEMNRKQDYAHDWWQGDIGLDKSITRQDFFDKHADKLSDVNLWPNGDGGYPLSRSDWQKQINAIVNGQFNNNGGNTASTSTGTSQTSTSTTVVNETWSLLKGLEKISESVRSLLSFEVKLPLNSPVFKNLHTNSMLWTQLPTEFKLGNLSKIFKLMGSWKAGRSVPYLENRWYIEKNVIKCDSNGLFATLTLNPFPSSYSTYSNAVKKYAEAYDQKFNKKTETSTITGTGGGAGTPRLGDDSTDTGSMAAMTGAGHGNAGDNRNFDAAAQKGYAQEGRSYFDWARQFNNPIALAKALNDMYTEAHPIYSNHRHSNAEQTFQRKVGNCWDGCRLVKCCFDAAGFDCVVITGSIYEGGHGWNAVKWNGRWYTFDLLYDVTSSGDWGGTNTLRMCDEW